MADNSKDNSSKRVPDIFDGWADNSLRTAIFISCYPKQAHSTRRLHTLYNHAARKLPDYVLEPSDHCFVQMPRHELAAAVYQAARKGGANFMHSLDLWRNTRFPK